MDTQKPNELYRFGIPVATRTEIGTVRTDFLQTSGGGARPCCVKNSTCFSRPPSDAKLPELSGRVVSAMLGGGGAVNGFCKINFGFLLFNQRSVVFTVFKLRPTFLCNLDTERGGLISYFSVYFSSTEAETIY